MKGIVLSSILFLALGLGIGYLVFGNKTSTTENEAPEKTISAQALVGARVGESPIDVKIAKELVQEYKIQNEADIKKGFGMQSRDAAGKVQQVQGFVISRKAIEDIFKNDGTQQCTGLRVYFAKHPDYRQPNQRVFTMIFVGTKRLAGNKGMMASDSTGGDIDQPIYDHVDPCPNNCGSVAVQ